MNAHKKRGGFTTRYNQHPIMLCGGYKNAEQAQLILTWFENDKI